MHLMPFDENKILFQSIRLFTSLLAHIPVYGLPRKEVLFREIPYTYTFGFVLLKNKT